MRQLVEAAGRPEVVVEGLRERERVDDQDPAGVVAHEQDRALGGDVFEAANLRPEVEVGRQLHPRQRPADVFGVAHLEPIALAGERASQVGSERAQHLRERIELSYEAGDHDVVSTPSGCSAIIGPSPDGSTMPSSTQL